MIILANLILGPLFYIMTGKFSILWGSLVEAGLIGLVIWLNAKRRHRAASLLFFAVLNIATFYYATILGKDVNAELMIIFMVGTCQLFVRR